MVSHNSNYDKFLQEISNEFPKFKILRKEDSVLMKSIDLFLRVITLGKMTTFMTQLITASGYTIYTHKDWHIKTNAYRIGVLRHERVHMRQIKNQPRILFTIKYLFILPTIFAFYRKKYEQEAYEETIRYCAFTYGADMVKTEEFRKEIIDHFTTAQYFWMWPFKKSLNKWYDTILKTLN